MFSEENLKRKNSKEHETLEKKQRVEQLVTTLPRPDRKISVSDSEVEKSVSLS